MWAERSVFYQIYPLGFCGAPRDNDGAPASRIGKIGDWAQHIQKLGADAVVSIREADPVQAVRQITGDLGADVVLECSGAPGTLVQAIHMARRGGRISLIGVAKDEVREPVPFKYVSYHEISITGSKANPNTSKAALALMASRQIDVRRLITHRFPLERMADALDTFVNRKDGAVKVVVCPNGMEGV